MKTDVLAALQEVGGSWTPPRISDNVSHGDMPGDKIHIGEAHIQKANTIFPVLLKELPILFAANPHRRAVVAVCGGSGVGKSETASLLSFYLRDMGIGCYTLSGDNYPRRTPAYNDAERLRVFRHGGLRGLIASGQYTMALQEALRTLQEKGSDADSSLCGQHPWLAVYLREGRKALAGYLGSSDEIDFTEVTNIVSRFQNGGDQIFLKRMGREVTEVWYEPVDFSSVNVLMMEWTHGNSDRFQGVDFPILLNSTPRETLEHRKARNRDGGVDRPFTAMVLELEQKMLEAQAPKAKLILAKSGEVLSYSAYRALMAQAE